MYDEKTYGLYYNWIAVNDARGLCPKGWHVPTNAEWTEMEEYVGSKSEYAYGNDPQNIAKALASNVGWEEYDVPGTPGFEPEKNNATGFTAVPAGQYYLGSGGYGDAIFWSSTEHDIDWAYVHTIRYYKRSVYWYREGKGVGCPVRCVRDI